MLLFLLLLSYGSREGKLVEEPPVELGIAHARKQSVLQRMHYLIAQ